MKITYHAWLRENLQVSEEHITLQSEQNLADVLCLLKNRNPVWHETFKEQKNLRYALNYVLCKDTSTVVKNEDVLSIFPTFTGG